MSNSYVNSFTSSIVESSLADYVALNLTATTQLAWPAYLPPGSGFATAARIMDVTTPNASYFLLLPIATQGAIGEDILITNRGTLPLTVYTYGSTASTLIGAGSSYYFVLTDNTSTNGTWKTVAFGVGTGAADAAVLAGNGLAAVGGQLAESFNVIQFSNSGFSLSDTSRANGYVWRGGQGTLTLPPIANLSKGWFIWLRNNGTGSLVLTPQGTSLINGLTSWPIDIGTSQVIAYDSNSSNFWSFGTVSAQNFSFSSSIVDTSSVLVNNLSLTNGAAVIQKYVDLSLTRTANLLVTLPAVAGLYALINQTGTSAYQVQFQLSGSVQTPISVATGTQTFISTDGTFIYVLASSTVGTLQLADGSASAPSLSFINEVNTGVYRAGSYQLGLTAGGNSVVIFDSSDATNQLLRAQNVTGIFKAIDGGLI